MADDLAPGVHDIRRRGGEMVCVRCHQRYESWMLTTPCAGKGGILQRALRLVRSSGDEKPS